MMDTIGWGPVKTPAEKLPCINQHQPQDGAYVIFTSETTGKPKGVMIEHRNIAGLMEAGAKLFGCCQRDIWTMFHSFCFDFSVWEMYSPLLSGGKLLTLPRLIAHDPKQYLEILKKQTVTILNQTPTVFYQLVQEEMRSTGKGLHLRYVIFGGEALKPAKIKSWKDKYPGTKLINMYGITETTVHVTFKEITDLEIELNMSNIGKVLPNMKGFIVNKNLKLQPKTIPGEFLVGGQGVARGYLNRPELTAEKFGQMMKLTKNKINKPFVEGPVYRSGDLVRLLHNGDMEYLGRIDLQVKIRGNRVETGEIERQMMLLPGIEEALVIPREDEQGNNYLCAYLKMKTGKDITVTNLRETLSKRLPDYMIPSYFIPVEVFPVTASGKIDQKKLSEPGGIRTRMGSTFAAPVTETEKLTAAVWQEVLRLDRVGIHDNFFDLGGTSLDIVRLNERLKKVFKKEIPVVFLFEYPTIRAFTRYLEQLETLEPGKPDTAGLALVEEKAPALSAGISGIEKSGEKMKDPRRRVSRPEIAVIGMAGRFPGSGSVPEFWENLKNGKPGITFFSDLELEQAGVPREDLKNPNYVKAKGLLADVQYFDASFFNFTVREAENMDPQMRILHETCWHALEDAGYNPEIYEGSIGFYCGVGIHLYWMAMVMNLARSSSEFFELLTVNDIPMMSVQAAYRLNLKGPAVTVQTACSASLVSVHMASRALLSSECDMALAGGVSVKLPEKSGYMYQEGMIMSRDGFCRPFDAGASGIVSGEGAGIVVLKPLENAVIDQDHIYAILKGTAVNNDGNRRPGFTAPSIKGQAEVIRIAMQAAGTDPRTITYVETHGTGTPLGDPVEIRALTQAFDTNKKQFCRIGSVKSNIGHLDAAAGIAGFIKTVLSIYHRMIPPSLHFETPNPAIDFSATPFMVNTLLHDWTTTDGNPRRAGVSSFGIGGTNAHVILEEWPLPILEVAEPGKETQLILLSSRTEAGLERNTHNLVEFLKKTPGTNLAGAAYTLQVGRKPFAYRRTLLTSQITEAAVNLANNSTKVQTYYAQNQNPPIVYIFPGLGSQYTGMGYDLYQNEPIFRKEMDTCFEILKHLTGYDLKKLLYPSTCTSKIPPADESIDHPEISPMAIFSIGYSLAALLIKWGIKPHALIGYSFGEYITACLAGVFTVEQALNLVVQRGKLVAQTPPGGMLSVPLTRRELMPMLPGTGEIFLAIDNGPSCIVAGRQDTIEAFASEMKGKKCLCMRLNAKHAIHTPLMDTILAEFEQKFREIPCKEPQIPYISNLTGQWQTKEQATNPGYWSRHLSNTVRFSEGIDLLTKEPYTIFIELGPGRDLCAMIQRTLDKTQYALNLTRPQQKVTTDSVYLLERLGRLWLLGKDIDWKTYYEG
ncbi:MAG: AMP-binding protein, partial [Acidobacteria bacterium]|nr:AMP-binding protein [Acidobacteriota bacterium]